MKSRVRLACRTDLDQLSVLRRELWPDLVAAEDAKELIALFGEQVGMLPVVIFVAEGEGGSLMGFVEVGLRSHADGCDPGNPVGFIEGWFVQVRHRRQGIGSQLVAAAEDWARSHGCLEIASDTWIDNEGSQRAHESIGFEVVDRCVHYRKAL